MEKENINIAQELWEIYNLFENNNSFIHDEQTYTFKHTVAMDSHDTWYAVYVIRESDNKTFYYAWNTETNSFEGVLKEMNVNI